MQEDIEKRELFLCMGSACHQLGVYEVLPVILRLLKMHELEATVELKGAFCLGPCRRGIVMQYKEHQFVDITADNAERIFVEEILPCLK